MLAFLDNILVLLVWKFAKRKMKLEKVFIFSIIFQLEIKSLH